MILDSEDFQENLIRFYLGKYQKHFTKLPINDRVTLYLDAIPGYFPILFAQVTCKAGYSFVVISEYLKIEQGDVGQGAFEYYIAEIIAVELEDPNGSEKIERVVGRSLLSGST